MKFRAFKTIGIVLFTAIMLQTNYIAAAAAFTPQGEVALLREYGTATGVRLLAFARGTDDKLYGNRQTADNVWAYQPFWKQIAGSTQIFGNIAAETKPNGSNYVFSKNSSDRLVFTCQSTPGGTWTDWAAIGGTTMSITGQIAVMRNADNTIQVFARGNSTRSGDPNRLYTLKQNIDGTWPAGWARLGDNIQIGDKIAVGRRALNPIQGLQVFVKALGTGNLLTLWQQSASGSWKTSYLNLGGALEPSFSGVHGDIAVANNAYGGLEVLSIDQARQKLRHIYQQPVTHNWSVWQDLPTDGSYDYGPIDRVALGRNKDGRLEAFALTSYLIMVHIAQLPNAVSSWGPIDLMPALWLDTASSSPIAVSGTGAGNITVFCMSPWDDKGNPNPTVYQAYKNDINIWTPFLETEGDEVLLDIENNVYHTVKIGEQTWTVENWKSTKYSNGIAIPKVENAVTWETLTTPAYCWFNNNVGNKDYGAFYNWYVVANDPDPMFGWINPNKIAPAGWHVPTNNDYNILQKHIEDNGLYANSLAAQSMWSSSGTDGSPGYQLWTNNSTGFNGFPMGWRSGGSNPTDDFRGVNEKAYWWTCQGGELRNTYFGRCSVLTYIESNFISGSAMAFSEGLSVRLIKNYPNIISHNGWKVTCDSEETDKEDGRCVNAIDDVPETIWHTKYYPDPAVPLPHWIKINLGQTYILSALRYLPRQDSGSHGNIGKYEIYVSADDKTWGTPVALGTFANNQDEKLVKFATPKSGQYVLLTVRSEAGGGPWTSAAEIDLKGERETQTESYYKQDFNSGMDGWTRKNNGGSASVESGALSIDAANTDTIVVDTNSPAYADGTVTYKVTPKNDKGRTLLVFRYTSLTSWAGVGYDVNRNWVWVNGAGQFGTLTPSGPALINGTTYTVKVTYSGSIVTLWVDGIRIYTGTVTQLPTGAGQIGFRDWNAAHVHYDDVTYKTP